VSATVLVVDDNPDNVDIMRSILLGEGFEVRIARDGESALRAVQEAAPDLVLLDVMMPGMDGFEVLDRLKADVRTAQLPVIMVTARATDDDVLNGYKIGAEYYLTKPFTRRQLVYAVGLVLGPNGKP